MHQRRIGKGQPPATHHPWKTTAAPICTQGAPEATSMAVDFTHALQLMATLGRASFGPRLFRSYCEEYGLGRPDTAQSISIDKLSALAPSLRDAETMVFRLGRHEGSGTSFGLARASSGDVREVFLVDEACLAATTPQVFSPQTPYRALPPFRLLPS